MVARRASLVVGSGTAVTLDSGLDSTRSSQTLGHQARGPLKTKHARNSTKSRMCVSSPARHRGLFGSSQKWLAAQNAQLRVPSTRMSL